MKKSVLLIFFIFVISGVCFSQGNNVNITVDVTNIVVNGGKVYLAIFANAEQFRKEEPFIALELRDSGASASQQVSLPPGEYVVSAFQDANNNQKMDYNLIGIPRELVGISNYDGKGLPTKNFDRQKIMLNNTSGRITIGLFKF
jgi:uncharacterized protein (DUF2141 family)